MNIWLMPQIHLADFSPIYSYHLFLPELESPHCFEHVWIEIKFQEIKGKQIL